MGINKFYNSFEDFYKTERKQINKIIFYLKKNNYRLKKIDLDTIKSIVEVSCWEAWKYHYKKYHNDIPQYSIFTFINKRILHNIPIYLDNIPFTEITVDVPDKNYGEHTDTIEHALKYLNEKERSVIYKRFFENKTLNECSKDMNLSIEWVRLVEKTALNKLKDILSYVD